MLVVVDIAELFVQIGSGFVEQLCEQVRFGEEELEAEAEDREEEAQASNEAKVKK